MVFSIILDSFSNVYYTLFSVYTEIVMQMFYINSNSSNMKQVSYIVCRMVLIKL